MAQSTKHKTASDDLNAARELARSLILHAYDHHKLHARFQESQRSWSMAGFITFSSALLALLGSSNFDHIGQQTERLMILIHLAFCVLTGIAITKMSRERGRHFQRAEEIIQKCGASLGPNDGALVALLASAELHTLSYSTSGAKQRLIQFLSVSAVFNYFIALFVAIDLSLLIDIAGAPLGADIALAFATFVGVAYLQHRYSRWLER